MDFVYWPIKGIVEPIRVLSIYLDNRMVEVYPGSFKEWKRAKKQLT